MRRCQPNPEVLFIPTCGNVNHCYVINSIDSPVPDRRVSAKKQKAKGTVVCMDAKRVSTCNGFLLIGEMPDEEVSTKSEARRGTCTLNTHLLHN